MHCTPCCNRHRQPAAPAVVSFPRRPHPDYARFGGRTSGATDAGSKTQALRQLLEAIELEGGLDHADALLANRPWSCCSPSAVPTS